MGTTSRQIVYVATDGVQTVETVDMDLFGNGTVAARPLSGAVAGDIYIVYDTSLGQYAWNVWNGTTWEYMEARKSNLTAVVAPTASDDNTLGYSVGSIWVNTATDNVYFATDVTTGAAVWRTTGGGGDVVGPGSSTDNAIARFDGNTGKLIQDSNTLVSDGGTITAATVAATSGTVAAFVAGAQNHTGQTASTEVSNWANPSYTRTWATGAIATQREWHLSVPTYAFAGASVITDAVNLYVAGAPAAGTNATLTNAYALWVDADSSRFDGRVLEAKGANVASASTLTLGGDGNTFQVTGTTTVNYITTTGWTSGSKVTLTFAAATTLTHNAATPPANTAAIFTQSGSNYATKAGSVVELVYDGTYWRVAALSPGDHATLLQLIHFIDEGPAEGFATGATKTVTGGLFPTEILWKRADTTNLVRQSVTWTGINPTTVIWRMYDTDGVTVLATVTDTITYSGVNETGRTRAIA